MLALPETTLAVFPAYVGMSPAGRVRRYPAPGVPRIRGDEPLRW